MNSLTSSAASPNAWLRFARLVKLEHTVFALPFALSALLLASPAAWPQPQTVLWVLLALVGGRTYAMGLNRLIDADIDAKNPRTADREIPSGQVSRPVAWLWSGLALLLMVGATTQLPPLCLQLLPVAVLVLSGYSFTKRFTRWCHLVLGVALACAAIGGWVAVTGSLSQGVPVLFGLAVLFWVAGFDVIYATQDVDFDRKEGLYSLPATLGVAQALTLSRMFHAVTILCLLGFAWAYQQTYAPVGWGYWAAVGLTTLMLIYEQRLVTPNDLSRVNAAFFTVNGIVSLGFFALVLLERLLSAIL